MHASTKREKIFQREKTFAEETKRVLILIALNWIVKISKIKKLADSYLSSYVQIKFVLAVTRNALVSFLRILWASRHPTSSVSALHFFILFSRVAR